MTEKLKQFIHHQIFIEATPEKVFDTITSAEGWNAFFTTGLEIDLKPGGDLWFRWKDWGPNFYNVEVPGEVLTVERPKLFRFEWGRTMKSIVEFHLEEKFGGTVLTVKEYDYPKTDEGIENILDCASGWGEAVTLLKFYLEHGIVYIPPVK